MHRENSQGRGGVGEKLGESGDEDNDGGQNGESVVGGAGFENSGRSIKRKRSW